MTDRLSVYKMLFDYDKKYTVNSQAPDVPELAHKGIFQLSLLCLNCYVKTMKNYTLYGVYISLNFGFRLNRPAFNDTKHILVNQKLFKEKKKFFLGSNFINLSDNLIK